jgi:hypothetical protein
MNATVLSCTWLRREPAGAYHARRGECLTSHRLADFRSCPLLFRRKELGLIPDRDSHAFFVGRAAHVLILEGRQRFEAEFAVGGPINPKTGQPYGSGTKAFAAWAEKRGKPVLPDVDAAMVEQMATSVGEHLFARELLAEGVAEGVVRCQRQGVLCQARLDWVNPKDGRGLVDLKTADSLDSFEWHIGAFGYMHQLAFYRALLAQACGVVLPVHIIAVEKCEPFRCGVWQIAPRFEASFVVGRPGFGPRASSPCGCTTACPFPEPHTMQARSQPAMTALAHIQKGRSIRPRRVMLYGVHGVGKSTFGAMAEGAIFITTEEGANDIEVDRFPLAMTYGDVLSAVSSLYTDEHNYQTVVVDSLDWLERLIFTDVCAKRGVESIEDIGYAKGYVFALTQWREILTGLDALRNERGMQVVLLAHAQIEKFANPETDTYDRYSPRLQKLASALVQEWADEVLFATYRVHTKTTKEGFDRKRTQGVGTGERIIRTTERPAHVAKNRLNLPDEIPLDYRVYAAFVRGENPLAATDTETTPTSTPEQEGA